MGRHHIAAPPVSESDRARSIETANAVFESVLERLDVDNPDAVRRLWNAEEYVDNAFLRDDMSQYASITLGPLSMHFWSIT